MATKQREAAHRAEILRVIESDEPEFFWEDKVICPWCGYEYPITELYPTDGDDFDEKCANCQKIFICEPEVSVTFSTRRPDEDEI